MNQIFTFTDSTESIYSENNFWGKTRNVILYVSFFYTQFFFDLHDFDRVFNSLQVGVDS